MLEPSVRLFIYNKVCHMVSFPNDTQCEHRVDETDEDSIQRLAAQYLTAYKALLNGPAILLGCFCGAWSDRVGRKLPVLVSCTGTIIAILVYLMSMVAENINTTLTMVLIGAGIRGIFGRTAVVTMALHSYITDLTTNDTRTRVLGRLLGMNYFGYFVGSILGGVLLDIVDFDIVFCIAIFTMGLCVFFCALFMKENTHHGLLYLEHVEKLHGEDKHDQIKLLDIKKAPFRPKHIKESFTVFLRPREDHLRCHILILFFTLLVQQMCKSGETDFTLLYVERQPFHWTEGMYGFFLATDYALLGIVTALLLPLILRCCDTADINLVLFGIFFKVIRLFIMLFSINTWQIYMSIIFGCPSALVIAGAKSMLSKAIGDDEIGKTFSLLSCGETVANLLGSLIFTTIYAATVTFFPGCVFVVDVALNLVLIVVVLFVSWDMRIMSRYALLRSVKGGENKYGTTNKEGHDGYGTITSEHKKGTFVPVPSASAFELSFAEDEANTEFSSNLDIKGAATHHAEIKETCVSTVGNNKDDTEKKEDVITDVILLVPKLDVTTGNTSKNAMSNKAFVDDNQK